MDFLLHIFYLSPYLHFFPSIWKTSSIILIHKMGIPLHSSFFWLISLTCVSKLFEHIILSRLLFFLESNSNLSPRQAGFLPARSTLDQILYLSQSISDGFNEPKPGSRTRLLESFRLCLESRPFSQIFRLASLLALLVRLNLFFLIGALAWFFKITKVALFEPVEVFYKDPFLAPYFSPISSMIFLLICLLSLTALYMLTT